MPPLSLRSLRSLRSLPALMLQSVIVVGKNFRGQRAKKGSHSSPVLQVGRVPPICCPQGISEPPPPFPRAGHPPSRLPPPQPILLRITLRSFSTTSRSTAGCCTLTSSTRVKCATSAASRWLAYLEGLGTRSARRSVASSTGTGTCTVVGVFGV
jgi:hypothetical protein